MLSTWSILALGFTLGLKHALDADHLAAVTAIASERKGVLRASLVGALWGAGHTVALLAAGVAVIVLHLEISARVAAGLEFAVALAVRTLAALFTLGLGLLMAYELGRGHGLRL
ncbi:MAG: hypothetical protein HY699_10600 [Deltaproteobacteria bacterium]|nr:hypothetical protein [Deltaproteobacteria bacterium]